MSKRVDVILIVALFYFKLYGVVSNDEISDDMYPSYEYKQIFQDIPDVFEYLLNAVEEKPEILERNEIPVSKRAIEGEQTGEAYDTEYKNPSDEDYCVQNKQAYEGNPNIANTESNNIEVNKFKANTNLRDSSTVAYEYGNSLLLTESNEDTCGMKAKREVSSKENMVLSKDKKLTGKKRKRDADKNEFVDSEDYSSDEDDVSKGAVYPGIQPLLSLRVTAKDIEHGMIMTEKLLEEYNNNKALNRESK